MTEAPARHQKQGPKVKSPPWQAASWSMAQTAQRGMGRGWGQTGTQSLPQAQWLNGDDAGCGDDDASGGGGGDDQGDGVGSDGDDGDGADGASGGDGHGGGAGGAGGAGGLPAPMLLGGQRASPFSSAFLHMPSSQLNMD